MIDSSSKFRDHYRYFRHLGIGRLWSAFIAFKLYRRKLEEIQLQRDRRLGR